MKQGLLINNTMSDPEDLPPPYSETDMHNHQHFPSHANTGDVTEETSNTHQRSKNEKEKTPLYELLTSDLDAEILNMSYSHKQINLEDGFKGKECRLKTTHAPIFIAKPIITKEFIELSTSHNTIEVKGALVSKDVRINTSHGTIKMNDENIFADKVEINTCHSPLLFRRLVMCANYIKIVTSHSIIDLDHISFQSELSARTSHAPINLRIKEIDSDRGKINVSTSYAPVNVHLPVDFSGNFCLKTSRAEVNVINKSGKINYTKNCGNEKEGVIINRHESKSSNQVYIKTSGSPVNLYIY